MMELLNYTFMQNAVLASVLGGVGCALIGVFIILLEIPLLGVAISHAAFAGATLGLLIGVNPLLMAFLFSVVSSFLVGPVADCADFKSEMSIGVIFSLMVGLGFLFLSLIKGPKTEAFSLIWGSILNVRREEILLMGVITLAVILLLMVFFKEIKAVMFDREIALSVGIPQKAIYYGILFFAGLVISSNLNIIGGVLIFSLIINPAAAAHQLTYNLKTMFVLAGLFGVFSCLLGLLFSYLFNLPTGGVVIVVSSIVFVFCLLFSPKKGVRIRV